MIVSVIILFLALLGLLGHVLTAIGGTTGYQLWIGLARTIIIIITYSLLLYACFSEKPSFIFPAMVLSVRRNSFIV